MSELVPLVVGGALTLVGGAGTEWLRDKRQSSQARNERGEVRQEQRDDLERQTFIELQDSLQTYVRGITRVWLFDKESQREHGQHSLVPDGLDAELHAAQVSTMKLTTRVSDEEIRGWIDAVITEGTAVAMHPSDEPQRHWDEMGRIAKIAQEKIGLRIRSL